jgi:hypothetical protein
MSFVEVDISMSLDGSTIWPRVTSPRPRWEQAFSEDGGGSWGTNWVMDYTRTGEEARPGYAGGMPETRQPASRSFLSETSRR